MLIYGIDVFLDNVAEAQARMAHVLLGQYQTDALSTVEPTTGFLNVAALILGDNIVCGDPLNAAHRIELCDGGRRAVLASSAWWSFALVPPAERDLFWGERVQDAEPVHYAELRADTKPATKAGTRRTTRSSR